MGFFSAVKDAYKKSEAAVIVQNLIEENNRVVWFEENGNPAQFANTLVGRAWDAMPDVLSGKFGQRPHKLSIAAVALSRYIESLGLEHQSSVPLVFALGKILQQVQVNEAFFGFNSTDVHLLAEASNVFHKYAALSEPVFHDGFEV